MSEERRQILGMLAEGKITVDEAERLLAHLESLGSSAERPNASAPGVAGAGPGEQTRPAEARPPKYLRVLVDDPDGDNVNIRVPFELIRTGIQLGAMLPSEARDALRAKGIDVSALNGQQGEQLVAALRELTVEVNDAEGDKVRIFCE